MPALLRLSISRARASPRSMALMTRARSSALHWSAMCTTTLSGRRSKGQEIPQPQDTGLSVGRVVALGGHCLCLAAPVDSETSGAPSHYSQDERGSWPSVLRRFGQVVKNRHYTHLALRGALEGNGLVTPTIYRKARCLRSQSYLTLSACKILHLDNWPPTVGSLLLLGTGFPPQHRGFSNDETTSL